MTFDEIVAAVKQQGGFDVSSGMVEGWVNEVHRQAVAESHWQMSLLSLGTTVVGQATYDVPATVADIVGIYIDSGDGPAHYGRVGTLDVWELRGGRRWLTGSGGVFAPAFSSAGQAQIELYPAPTTAGDTIQALTAGIPADMATGGSPVIPADMHGDLVDGAIALGLLRVDERPEQALVFEQRFRAMVGKLRRRKNSRVGSAPSRLQVAGYDW